jgi:hypothetical protein
MRHHVLLDDLTQDLVVIPCPVGKLRAAINAKSRRFEARR